VADITFSDQEIEQAIAYHKFVSLIEVTNGITLPQKRQEKKKQLKKGKSLIEKRFGDEVDVVCGLALIKNTQREIKELDFSIKIPQYNSVILYKVLEDILSSDFLKKEEKDYLKAISESPMGLASKLNFNHVSSSKRKRRGMILRNSEYKRKGELFAKIKGVILEHYVGHLFDIVMEGDYKISLRTDITDFEKNPNEAAYTDILIAAPPAGFRSGLENLAEMYSGRQRIKVETAKIINNY